MFRGILDDAVFPDVLLAERMDRGLHNLSAMAGEGNPDPIASSAAAARRGRGAGAWSLVLLSSMLAACSVKPAGDHAAPDEEWTEELVEPLCSPKLTRYPVAGPHNGGYDKNALNYTCHPHPGSSPDGSDFIAGDHYGNDIFAAKGTPMVAPVSGTVVTAGTNTLGGWVVKIRGGAPLALLLASLAFRRRSSRHACDITQ